MDNTTMINDTFTSSEDTNVNTVESTPIAPDSIVTTTKTNGFIKSRKKTSFKEFVTRKGLRREVIAGFKVWLRGNMFFFDKEWEQKFNEYTNRKI